MNAKFLLILSAALGLLLAVFIGLPIRGENRQDSSTDLEQLRLRITQLEERVKKLEQSPKVVALPQTTPALPGRNVPDNWTEHQFNGMTYYIVPLEARNKNKANK